MKLGNREIGKSGNRDIGKSGNREIWKLGNWEIGKSGNWKIGKLGNLENGKSVNREIGRTDKTGNHEKQNNCLTLTNFGKIIWAAPAVSKDLNDFEENRNFY